LLRARFARIEKELLGGRLKLRREQVGNLVERIGNVQTAQFFERDFVRLAFVQFKEARLFSSELSI